MEPLLVWDSDGYNSARFAYERRLRSNCNWSMKGPNIRSFSVNDRLREHGDDRKNPTGGYISNITYIDIYPVGENLHFWIGSLLCCRCPIDRYPVKVRRFVQG